MNKDLHVGHLKNLCIANALVQITEAQPVAMLGVANGVKSGALEKYKQWCELAEYEPKLYFDVELPAPTTALSEGTGEYAGCKMLGSVVVYKSSGASTYAAHDLSFAETVSPDYYLTGGEQKAHFESLGLGNKHLAMGLVLGADAKKMKSTIKQEGDALNKVSADELVKEIFKVIKPTEDPLALVWNVLAWQFNSTTVKKDTIVDVEGWASTTSPGIYISHTNAKISKALGLAKGSNAEQMTLEDAQLCGYASYYKYFWQKAIEDLEPTYIAQFTLKLAKKLSEVYAKKSIQNGDPGFIFALSYAVSSLQQCMKLLGMKILEKV